MARAPAMGVRGELRVLHEAARPAAAGAGQNVI